MNVFGSQSICFCFTTQANLLKNLSTAVENDDGGKRNVLLIAKINSGGDIFCPFSYLYSTINVHDALWSPRG